MATEKAWYDYPIVVPFGNPNYDSSLGGSHDLDVAPPPNYPVTALLAGTVSDISAPPWGKQVCLRLDSPYNGVPYCAYLHLSATNPALSLGSHVQKGDLLGWVGGANNGSQYAGTSNPTGQNFLNPPFQSSRIQVGFALMRGAAYGGVGWENFPPIDWSLDPTPLIEAARSGTLPQVEYPGALDFIITDPAWVFTDALTSVPASDLTIVIHKTACGAMCTATQVAQGFQNDTQNHKSVHFVVGRDGSVLQVILLKDGAGGNCCLEVGHDVYWDRLQQKYSNLNTCTISIEHEDWTSDNSQTMTDAQLKASFALVLWLVQKFSLPPTNIQGHMSLDPVTRARCPGTTYPLSDLVNYVKNNVNPPPPPTDYKRKAFETQWTALIPDISTTSGIANAAWLDYQTGKFHGPALTKEYATKDWNGKDIVAQEVANGTYTWDGAPHFYHTS